MNTEDAEALKQLAELIAKNFENDDKTWEKVEQRLGRLKDNGDYKKFYYQKDRENMKCLHDRYYDY
eukprot:6488672-Amphidinium_carterae.4